MVTVHKSTNKLLNLTAILQILLPIFQIYLHYHVLLFGLHVENCGEKGITQTSSSTTSVTWYKYYTTQRVITQN